MRLFVAFEIPAPVRAAVAQRVKSLCRLEDGEALPRARWVAEDNLHLTLAFLGEREERYLEPLEAALAPVFAGFPPMTFRLSGAGRFPPRGPARVLWVGMSGSPALADLRSQVELACGRTLGTEPDRRPFHAHITVARCRRPWGPKAVERFVECFSPALGDEFVVRSGTLFESRLGPRGARYRALINFPLVD